MQEPVDQSEIIPPLHSKTVKAVVNIFLLKCSSLVLAQCLYFIIDRFYGAEAVGAFALYISVITIGGLLSSFGFGNAALKLSGAVGSEAELDAVAQAYRIMMRATAIASGGLALLILLFAPQMAAILLDDPERAPVFYCTALAIMPFALLEISSEMIRGRGKTNLYMIFKETGLWLMAAPVLVFLLLSHYGYLSPIISHLVAVVMFSAVGIFVVKELLKSSSTAQSGAHSLSSLLKLSVPMLMSKGLVWVSLYIDILILSVFVDNSDVGIYLVLNRLAAFAVQVSYSINVYVAPRIAYHYQQGRFKHLEKLTCDSVRYGTWIVLPFIGLLVLVGRPILGWFGEGNEYLLAFLPFLILLLANLLDTASGPVGYLLNMTGKEKSLVHIMIFCTVSRIVLLLVTVGYFQMGLMGAALSQLGFTVLWNAVSLFVTYSHLKFLPLYIPFYRKKI
jgi:O-antigen/teichoic acid export membrane protein